MLITLALNMANFRNFVLLKFLTIRFASELDKTVAFSKEMIPLLN